MPEVFKKNCKIKVIEYGEHYKSSPFWSALKTKIKSLWSRKAA